MYCLLSVPMESETLSSISSKSSSSLWLTLEQDSRFLAFLSSKKMGVYSVLLAAVPDFLGFDGHGRYSGSVWKLEIEWGLLLARLLLSYLVGVTTSLNSSWGSAGM